MNHFPQNCALPQFSGSCAQHIQPTIRKHLLEDMEQLVSILGSGRFPWRRAWQPTPLFLPGQSRRQRSLVGGRPWGPTESGTTQATWHAPMHKHIEQFFLTEVTG